MFLAPPSVCPSIRCCGRSSLEILIGFISKLYMDCFYQTLVQDRIRVLSDKNEPRWPTKWPPPISLQLWTLYVCHLLLDIFQISYMNCFYRTLVQVPTWAFVQRTITKMANKMTATHQFRCFCRSNLVILTSFLSNFIYGLLPSKHWFKFQ